MRTKSGKGEFETHVLALSVRKVKVTKCNGSSTIAKALINPGSSASFAHEQLAQHLHLQRSNKNVCGRSCRNQHIHMRICMVPGVWRR